jgi:hypothetical protein
MDFALDGRLAGACAVIVVVLVALSGIVRLAARPGMPGDPAARLVSVVETTFLPNAASLHIVRLAERYYAVGRSGAHIATLCEIPVDSVARWREARRRAPLFARLRRPRV